MRSEEGLVGLVEWREVGRRQGNGEASQAVLFN